MSAWLNKILNVRSGEWPLLLTFSLAIVLPNICITWGMTVVYSAFITQTGLGDGLATLAWVMLLGSLLSIPALAIYTTVVDRVDNNRLFAYIFIFGAMIIAAGMILLVTPISSLAFPVLYVLSTAWLAILNPHIFTYLNDLYDIQDAKRILPVILAIGSSGAALAGFMLKVFSDYLAPNTVIWIWFVSDILTAGVILSIPWLFGSRKKNMDEAAKSGEPTSAKKNNSFAQNFQEGLKFTLNSNFIRWLALGAFFCAVLMALLEYQTMKVLAETIKSPTEYTGWLGLLSGISNTISLVFLFFGVSRTTKTLGVGNTSLIFPIGNLIISAGLVGAPILFAPLAQINRQGLHPSLQEPIEALLYNAVPLRLRGRVRAFLGGLIVPTGIIFGVLLLFIDIRGIPFLTWLLRGMIVLLAAFYVISAFMIRYHYTQALVKMLEEEDYSFLISDDSSELVVSDPVTLQKLQKKLEESTNHEMRIFMTRLIAQVGGTQSLSILISTIKTTSEARTRAAMLNVLAVTGMRGDKLRGLYVDFLSDTDAKVRQAAATGLEQLLGTRDPWLQNQLTGMIQDPDSHVSLYALQFFANTGEFYKFNEAVQKLDQLVESESVELQKNAIDVLGKIERPQAIGKLVSFLENKNEQIRLEAILEVEGLALPFGNILDEKILEKIRSLQNDPVARIRQGALSIIGKFKQKADYPILIAALSDKNSQVRTAAIEALQSAGKNTIPIVQAAMKSPDSQTRKMAAVTLARIDQRQFESLIEVEVTDSLEKIYQNIAIEQILLHRNECSSVRVLLSALRETNHMMADEILFLFSTIHSSNALTVVRESLTSNSVSTRKLALEALESLTSPKTAALIASLYEPELTPQQMFTIGKETLNLSDLTVASAFEILFAPSTAPLLSLLAVQALSDIGDNLSNPDEPANQPSDESAQKAIDVQAFLKIAMDHPDTRVKKAAQTAKEKLLNKEQETQQTLSNVERIILMKENHFFRNIPVSQLETLATVCEEREYVKDDRIFHKGDPGGVLFLVINGQVGIEQEKRGGSAMLATINAGSYFGEMSLFDDSTRSASAIALQPSYLLSLNRGPIISVAIQNPDISLEIINVLSQRMRETGERIGEAARARPRELHKLFDQFD